MPSEVTRRYQVDVRELRFRRVRMIVTSGPDAGLSRDLEGEEFSIGTAVGNHLVLTDGMVSRHHCVIETGPQGMRLKDLGSTNGTKLAGFRIEAAYLTPGATILCGQTTLRMEALDGEIHHALSSDDRFDRVLGRSPLMRRIFAALPRIAASDSTVLLVGETGTGKGLLAKAIHAASPRASKPFVVVDCSAIPASLIESELLGHEKGSYTGAHASRAGSFEFAHGGTVFLDEIGELPIDVQPKLLRALEERVIRRVGGNEQIRLDVRVIAATNRDLRRAVNDGVFRQDLLYRLNTFSIRVPPLRERREDIPQLVEHFHEQFAATGAPPRELVDAFARRPWPGNVRELRNAVERNVLLGDPDGWDDQEDPADASVESSDDSGVSFRAAKELATARWERAYLQSLLARHSGNLSHAAAAARMDRTHLRALIRRHGIAVPRDGAEPTRDG